MVEIPVVLLWVLCFFAGGGITAFALLIYDLAVDG